jgi:hypothetical protein
MQPYNMRILSDLPLLGYYYFNYLRFLGFELFGILNLRKGAWKIYLETCI